MGPTPRTHSQRWIADGAGSAWAPQRHAVDSAYPNYLITWSHTKMSLWVVHYRDRLGYYIVDGAEGDCGEEPVVAGPYKKLREALTAALMLGALL